MTLYLRSYSFADPNFSDTPVVENNEGTKTFMGVVRSATQAMIASIIKEILSTENTVVKVIKKDATELYEVTINKASKSWDVNDNGEVLLYTETISGETTVKELTLLNNVGNVKWSIDLGTDGADAVAVGTSYAVTIKGSIVKFYDAANGSLVKTKDAGKAYTGEMFASADGFTIVYRYTVGTSAYILFVNKDGDKWEYAIPLPWTKTFNSAWITGRDTTCGRVSFICNVVTSSDQAGGVGIMFRTGETYWVFVRMGTGTYVLPKESGKISPCGEWCAVVVTETKIYYLTTIAATLVRTVSFKSGETGNGGNDLSFYGKYIVILHDSNNVWAYNLKTGALCDNILNPLRMAPTITCSD